MSKAQILAIFASVVLFVALYFGFDTKPDKQKSIEHSRSLQGESTSFETLLQEATTHLSPAQLTQVSDIEKQIEAATEDQKRVELLKMLSGIWYDFNQLPIAGGFAEKWPN